MARAMKDSGVEWIGEIPEGWEIKKCKYLASVQAGYPFDSRLFTINEGFPLIRIRDVTSGCIETYYKGDYLAEYIVGKGDLLVGMDGDFKVRLWDNKDALLNQRCCRVLTPDTTLLHYLALCLPFHLNLTNELAYSTTVKHLSNGDILNAKLPLPSSREMSLLVDYVEAQTADIDASIAKTRESIEEYKKLKQAVITQAVTKGIRPGRAMKDSGVEWWPYISEDCEITRIGRVCTIILGKMLTPQPRAESDTIEPYFCAANVHFGRVDDVEGLKRMWFSPREKDDYLVTDEDMLVVEGGAGAGGAAIVKRLSTPAYIQNSIMIVRGGTLCDNRYVCYALESLVKRGYIDIACNKATIPHFTKEKVSATCIPYRSKEEQQEIAAYLDEKCGAIDDLIEKKQAIITELEAYKKSLIYEYVTGKKEIPAGA